MLSVFCCGFVLFIIIGIILDFLWWLICCELCGVDCVNCVGLIGFLGVLMFCVVLLCPCVLFCGMLCL